MQHEYLLLLRPIRWVICSKDFESSIWLHDVINFKEELKIMKQVVVLFLMVLSGIGYGQDLSGTLPDSVKIDSVMQDTIVDVPANYRGVYLKFSKMYAPHYNGYNHSSSFGLGLQNNRWRLEFNIIDFRQSIQEFVIFPNQFELDYRYAGTAVAYRVIKRENFNADMVATLARGDMLWSVADTGLDFLRDEFTLYSITTDISSNHLRFVIPYISFGYQGMRNLNLERVKSSDFAGFIFVFGVQIGYFNQ